MSQSTRRIVVSTDHDANKYQSSSSVPDENGQYNPDFIPQHPEDLTFHNRLYAPSGFDVMKALIRVANRPNPQIDLGPVDCSAAIIVCDSFLTDTPIVYCSQAFAELTGYEEKEILGRNCRFLQSSLGRDADRESAREIVVSAPNIDARQVYQHATKPIGAATVLASQHELMRLRSALTQKKEVQIVVRNYTRNGIPFDNLLTIIPVRWDSESDHLRYLVGFQVRLQTSQTYDAS